MIRVVSLAVFGESNHYRGDTAFFRRHLGAVVRGYRALFPDWEIRIHHDDSLYQGSYGAALHGLARRGVVRLVRVAASGELCKAMLWRLLPIWDPEVEYVISRDVDACPLYADRVAVEDFIRSGAAAHSIGAVPAHATPLSGGLCGFQAPTFRELTGFSSWEDMVGRLPGLAWGTHGADEMMLRLLVWPLVRAKACAHRVGGAPILAGVQESHAEIDRDHPVPGLAPELAESWRLAEYLGICGFDAARAAAFFDSAAPAPAIAAAESFAGESPTGDVARLPWAVIASDRNPFYAWFAPLTARLWRRLGFRARLFLVGTSDEWGREAWCRLVVTAAREAGASIVFIPRIEAYGNGTVAQLVRLFAAGFGFEDDEFAYVADVDFWPLSRAFFCDRDFDRLLLLAANTSGIRWSMTLGARARTWRELMATEPGGGTAALHAALARWVVPGGSMREENWIADENLLAAQVLASPRLADAVQVIRSGEPPVDRIDRLAWFTPTSLDGFVDAHLPRPGWEHWPSLHALFALALPNELEWADGYQAAWQEATR